MTMTEPKVSNVEIEALIAQQAIRERIYRYCRGEDRLDGQSSQSLWHADGTASYGSDLYHGPATGWAAAVHSNLANFTGSHHQVGNIIIELDGERASSESYVTARVWSIADDGAVTELVNIGRYLDRWSRRDGVWGVDHRRFVFDLAYRTNPVGPAAQDGSSDGRRAPDWFEGRQGTSDPSYEVLFQHGGAVAEPE